KDIINHCGIKFCLDAGLVIIVIHYVLLFLITLNIFVREAIGLIQVAIQLFLLYQAVLWMQLAFIVNVVAQRFRHIQNKLHVARRYVVFNKNTWCRTEERRKNSI